MKEIIAVIRMNKVSATKKALVEVGVAGFTAIKVLGRGRLVADPTVIADRRKMLLTLSKDDAARTEKFIVEFLDGTRLFPRRLFTILAHDEDVPKIVAKIIEVNRTDNKVGDGKIFILPVFDAIRVRTGETGDAAV
ncbi:P-II family nitrogen regulator [Sporomusa termitida]|uniref:Nitrogen regulatory protein P-II n=1 Tax=Sporomusa termitida TaxID=2377 RepID=A0A517DR57_9FIRM|nr:P-II family nitrogen regulator [Sporomusa termitida]QDR79854.1 Nitrogen regulatory protein P-II [Sporomusa termitida]